MDGPAAEHRGFAQLVARLDASGGWRQLYEIGDMYGPVLRDAGTSGLKPSPAAALLRQLLGNLGGCTAGELAELLQAVGLSEAAEPLLPPLPLSVRPLRQLNGRDGEVRVPLTEPLRIVCHAEARPAPHFQWLHDGVPLSDQQSDQLQLSAFSARHAGLYSCQVRTDAECRSAGSVRVRPCDAAPQLVALLLDGAPYTPGQKIAAAPDRQLTCVWSGWPQVRCRWERDDVPLHVPPAQLHLQPADHTLPLGALGDRLEGSYVCIASNSAGEGWSDTFEVVGSLEPRIVIHPRSPQHRLAVGRQYQLTSSAICHTDIQVVWRKTVDDRDCLVSPADFSVRYCSESGLQQSELRLVPLLQDVQKEHRVTCEFVSTADPTQRWLSLPAVFRATFAAHSKLALIIGNSRYDQLEPLHKVDEDVELFRVRLERLGFGTLVCMNLSRGRTERVLRYFVRVAAPDCYMVVFLAGHGFTHQHRDYMVPVDAVRPHSGPLPDFKQCISLDELETSLQLAEPAVLAICADMCRSINLISPKSSLVRAVSSPVTPSRNVLRLFSAQIGQEAFDDGRFMRHLLQHIDEDITIQELGLKTLQLEGCQAPILEIAIAEQRSLLDCNDHLTVLDCCVRRRHHIQLGGVEDFWLSERWYNYVCDEDGTELRLTLTLSRDCGSPPGQVTAHAHQPQPDWYVEWAVLRTAEDPPAQVVLVCENVDAGNARSSWRCGRCVGGGVSIELLVILRCLSPSGQETEQRRKHGYRAPPLYLDLGPLGLRGEFQQSPPEVATVADFSDNHNSLSSRKQYNIAPTSSD